MESQRMLSHKQPFCLGFLFLLSFFPLFLSCPVLSQTLSPLSSISIWEAENNRVWSIASQFYPCTRSTKFTEQLHSLSAEWLQILIGVFTLISHQLFPPLHRRYKMATFSCRATRDDMYMWQGTIYTQLEQGY